MDKKEELDKASPDAAPRSVVDLDKNYQNSLQAIERQFKGSGRDAADHFLNLYNAKSFFKRTFFQERFKNPNTKTTAKDKVALIAAERHLTTSSLPNLILELLVANPGLQLVSKHDGYYRYWRHYPTHPVTRNVRWGVIRLWTEPGIGTHFEHWSYDYLDTKKLRVGEKVRDWSKFSEPEDTGFAFFTSNRFYYLAFRRDNIRLSISTAIQDDQKIEEHFFNGITLSTTKDSQKPFASAFVMVHQKHPLARKHLTVDRFKEMVHKTVDLERFTITS